MFSSWKKERKAVIPLTVGLHRRIIVTSLIIGLETGIASHGSHASLHFTVSSGQSSCCWKKTQRPAKAKIRWMYTTSINLSFKLLLTLLKTVVFSLHREMFKNGDSSGESGCKLCLYVYFQLTCSEPWIDKICELWLIAQHDTMKNGKNERNVNITNRRTSQTRSLLTQW